MALASVGDGFWTHVNRVCKYLAIATLLLVDLMFIFTMFSGYIDRRQFDKIAAQDKSGDSYYTLSYKVIQLRANLTDYYDTRCAQRDAIAFYRLSTLHVRDQLAQLYDLGFQARSRMKSVINSYSEVNADATNYALQDSFGIAPRRLVFLNTIPEERRAVVSSEILKKQTAISNEFVENVKQQLPDLYKIIRLEIGKLAGAGGEATWRIVDNDLNKYDDLIFNFSAIREFETKYKDLDKSVRSRLEDTTVGRAFIQMMITQNAAISGDRIEVAAQSVTQLLNPVRGVDTDTLGSLNCDKSHRAILRAVDQFFRDNVRLQAIDKLRTSLAEWQIPEDAIPRAIDTAWASATGVFTDGDVLHSNPGSPGRLERLQGAMSAPFRGAASFSSKPLTIQTLIVTVLFGIAGALSINALQLSRRGFWKTVSDPGWGEIMVSVVLGACAALMVFLLATLGLIVVSDGQSATGDFSTVGASLVGVLGFISGLLNDEAFGRLKQVGRQFLGAPEESVGLISSVEDDLIDVLRDGQCERFAALVLVHRAVEEVASQIGKVALFLPSDAILDKIPPTALDRLTSLTDEKPFRGLLDRSIYPALISPDELRAREAIVMRDSTKYVISIVDADTVQVDGGTIALARVRYWRDTPIFIFETPPKAVETIWRA